MFKKEGKVFEEKVGRQFADNMTEAKAAGIRAERIEGKRASRKEIREAQEAIRQAELQKPTIERLWEIYRSEHAEKKSLRTDGIILRIISNRLQRKHPTSFVRQSLHA